ncbi:DmsE family decaheme c-type cytochrome [Aromatoleum toluclasticum]|uniref:DmsE family decaheme c-type cytochrome n=1 Tax=Aromatoleum toluclasticum TaxID=92003 RepID=UPI001D18B0D8|nr:DmsE family decaheme c-type cytochrome [Aromatoleum toluclasticum]MCC4115756.1 DmsE family decaheme c-type cytochrome [Aromatoleum toluclasticum]
MKLLGKALRVCAFAVLAGSLSPALTATAAEKEAPKDIVLKGDAKCTSCHDENDSPEALRIGKTKHGTVADKRTPSCTNCHGESEKHVKEAGRGSGPTPPVDVGFTKKNKTTSAEAQNASCLSCHQGGKHINWQSSVHAQRGVTCASCHKAHTGHDKVREKETQTEVCFACHKEQRAQVNRPSHHPIPEGKMSCTSCHDVHNDNPKQLMGDTVNDTCYSCHMEKRGPFVHNHQPVTEDCSICHNPHGTNIANLLKARPPYLCQECHSHESHPSQAAGLPTGRTTSTSALGTVGRGCLNCHTNIHGGNSTQNSATAGRFRR